ncbi:hypothetical protein ACFV8E_13325 [Streptomyces sp. NPDC059849]|uniref:hypothetical protein n=1 Tax=Streptomyces sp. NPDC059849 TaxID=3346969 RepID=UPI003665EEAD
MRDHVKGHGLVQRHDTARLFGSVEVEVVGVEAGADDIPRPAQVTCDERARCCSD